MVEFFSGHLIPGNLFLLLALRWSITTSYNYVKSSRHRSTVTMNLPCNFMFLQSQLVETVLKLIGGIYGVSIHVVQADEAKDHAIKGIIEYNGDFGDTWSIMYRTKHHYIIYAVFLLSSIVELLVYFGVHLPKNSDRAMLILTFGVEGFMFLFHLTARSDVDVEFHVMQTASIFGCLLFAVLEAVNDRQVLYTYGRCLFVALQGTWFFQTAFALYYPLNWSRFKWDLTDQRLTTNVIFCFCVHFISILLVLIFIHLFMEVIINRSLTKTKSDEKVNQICFNKFNNVILESIESAIDDIPITVF